MDAPAIATGLPTAQVQKIWKAAQDFEAMALNQFLSPIFDTVDTSGGLFGGGKGESAMKPMLVDSIAKQMEQRGGLGLAQPIFRQMIQIQEARGEPNA